MQALRPRTQVHDCVHRQGLAYTGLIHAYVSTDLHMQLGFQKPMKCKFSTLKTKVWNELHISGSHSKPLFFNYIKPYMVYFKNTENSKGKPKTY